MSLLTYIISYAHTVRDLGSRYLRIRLQCVSLTRYALSLAKDRKLFPTDHDKSTCTCIFSASQLLYAADQITLYVDVFFFFVREINIVIIYMQDVLY